MKTLTPINSMSYGFRIERTAKKIKQTLQKRFNENNIDLTVDQWVILDHLYQSNGLSQNELADYTFKDAPTVTRIIDLLCKKELTHREVDEDDRRKFRVFLSSKGKRQVEQALPIVRFLRVQGRQGISEPDYAVLLKVLDKVFENFDED